MKSDIYFYGSCVIRHKSTHSIVILIKIYQNDTIKKIKIERIPPSWLVNRSHMKTTLCCKSFFSWNLLVLEKFTMCMLEICFQNVVV